MGVGSGLRDPLTTLEGLNFSNLKDATKLGKSYLIYYTMKNQGHEHHNMMSQRVRQLNYSMMVS